MSELMKVRPCAESNWTGFGVNDTSRMPLNASPASSLPALRPLRGSFPVGYVGPCTTRAVEGSGAALSDAWCEHPVAANASRVTAVVILRTCSISEAPVVVSKDIEHLFHDADLGGLYGLHVIRKY